MTSFERPAGQDPNVNENLEWKLAEKEAEYLLMPDDAPEKQWLSAQVNELRAMIAARKGKKPDVGADRKAA